MNRPSDPWRATGSDATRSSGWLAGVGGRTGWLAGVCGLLVAAGALALPSASLGGPVTHCQASRLHLSILDAEGAAGGRFWDLALRNTGPTTCELRGFPGVGLLDKQGKALPTKVIRASGFPSPLVTIKPGHSGYFTFHYESAGPCIPHDFSVYGLEVFPPNDLGRLVLKPGKFTVCDVSVGGAPTVTPMRAGKQLG